MLTLSLPLIYFLQILYPDVENPPTWIPMFNSTRPSMCGPGLSNTGILAFPNRLIWLVLWLLVLCFAPLWIPHSRSGIMKGIPAPNSLISHLDGPVQLIFFSVLFVGMRTAQSAWLLPVLRLWWEGGLTRLS